MQAKARCFVLIANHFIYVAIIFFRWLLLATIAFNSFYQPVKATLSSGPFTAIIFILIAESDEHF